MYKILRIICCVICALLLAACIFIFVYLGTIWGICSVVAAAALFALTILFKGLQEDYDKKHPSPDKQNEEQTEKKTDENQNTKEDK